jgi:UDP-N-acetylmuramoylalanine--D-glutamate ligase
MDLSNKHILVVGLGRSGVSTARFLAGKPQFSGCTVTAADSRKEDAFGGVPAELRNLGVNLEFGPHREAIFESCDLIVLSPGVPHTIPPVVRARENGTPVIGEIELAYRFINVPIIAVTGTNGKSTTTLLIAEMLNHSGFRVMAGGNLGTPVVELVNQQHTLDFIVAEISSFQLDTIEKFRPLVSVILNITDDHLDRHQNFAEYARSKARIFKNQTVGDICVLNEADETILSVAENLSARRFVFNSQQFNENRSWISDHTIWFYTPESGEQHVDSSETLLVGRHNLENISAAGLAVLAVGGTTSGIQGALKKFQGLPHRVTYVDTVGDVRFYDDSKATNVNAVDRALESFDVPVVLIMGGRDKGGGYEGLKARIVGRVRQLVVMGEAAGIIKSALGDAVPTITAPDMAGAVRTAASAAMPGDCILLSPACSSFDMYESYARRGEDFARAVDLLKKGAL